MGCSGSRNKDNDDVNNNKGNISDHDSGQCQEIDETKDTPSVPRTRVMSVHIANRADQLSKSFENGGLETAATEEILRKLVKNDKTLTDLRIVNSGMYADMKPNQRDKEFKSLAKSIANNKYITSVTLVNIGANDAFAEALAVAVSMNPRISSVNLETNTIGQDGVMAIASALAESMSVTELRLGNQKNGISTDALEALVQAVEQNQVTTVCSVDMRDGSMQKRLDDHLRNNMDLVRKERHATNVSMGVFTPTLTAIQKKIQAFPEDKPDTVDFSDNIQFIQMSNEWKGQKFCSALALNPSIVKLGLAGLQLKDNFATIFADIVLSGCPTLEEINLGRNQFTGEGIKAIASGLERSSVKTLKLNDQNGSAGAEAEAALVTAAEACASLLKINLDWKSNQHRTNCDRILMRNADNLRRRRSMSKKTP
eukprot:m.1073557 g.1073557  ORF g.1073557 m.1073557 type:complete len:426 (-) comp24235_c0_seq3:2172-3449(-)